MINRKIDGDQIKELKIAIECILKVYGKHLQFVTFLEFINSADINIPKKRDAKFRAIYIEIKTILKNLYKYLPDYQKLHFAFLDALTKLSLILNQEDLMFGCAKEYENQGWYLSLMSVNDSDMLKSFAYLITAQKIYRTYTSHVDHIRFLEHQVRNIENFYIFNKLGVDKIDFLPIPYLDSLKAIREKFRIESIVDYIKAQSSLSQDLRKLVATIIAEIQSRLGSPILGKIAIVALGSSAKGICQTFSDMECLFITENEPATVPNGLKYLQAMETLLKVYMLKFEETQLIDFPFSFPSGFHLDIGESMCNTNHGWQTRMRAAIANCCHGNFDPMFNSFYNCKLISGAEDLFDEFKSNLRLLINAPWNDTIFSYKVIAIEQIRFNIAFYFQNNSLMAHNLKERYLIPLSYILSGLCMYFGWRPENYYSALDMLSNRSIFTYELSSYLKEYILSTNKMRTVLHNLYQEQIEYYDNDMFLSEFDLLSESAQELYVNLMLIHHELVAPFIQYFANITSTKKQLLEVDSALKDVKNLSVYQVQSCKVVTRNNSSLERIYTIFYTRPHNFIDNAVSINNKNENYLNDRVSNDNSLLKRIPKS